MIPVNRYSDSLALNREAEGSYSYIAHGMCWTCFRYQPFGGDIYSAPEGLKVAAGYQRYGMPVHLMGYETAEVSA